MGIGLEAQVGLKTRSRFRAADEVSAMAETRVLVVEDEPAARSLLQAILEDDGYRVHAVAEGREALKAAERFRPHLALLDGGLPGLDGAEVARRLRQEGDLPIIFVTGADSPEAIRRGFRIGADDYIVKPFDPEELSWRVRAVLRRADRPVAQVLEAGDLAVDEGTHEVTRAGAPVSLTAIEYKLLAMLVRKRRRILTKAELLGEVWGFGADGHLLEVHMSSLRRKLEAHGPRIIHTVRGTGYILRT
jgi:two-component system, OmpR family, response regulator